MRYPARSRLAAGLMLVLLGAWFLAVQCIKSLQLWAPGRLTRSLILVGVGALFGITALVLWTPPLLVPASIISGLGLLMYWQNLPGNWPVGRMPGHCCPDSLGAVSYSSGWCEAAFARR